MFSKLVKITSPPFPKPLDYRRISFFKRLENLLEKIVFKNQSFQSEEKRALEVLNMSLDEGISQLMHKYTQRCPLLK
jgi:hypothetical protein